LEQAMTQTDEASQPAAPGGPGLTRYTGYLLRRAYARSADLERSCLPHDVGLREVSVLAALQTVGPVSQRELGERLHVNRSVMVKLVDALERRRWVVRERNPHDRRSYALRVTGTGSRILEDTRADVARLEAELTAALDADERQRLGRHLRSLLESVAPEVLGSLDDATPALLGHAHRTLRDRANGAFEPLGIDPRGFAILSVVAAEQPCSRALVAARIGVTPPAVQGSIDDLIGRGYLGRATNAEDRREHALEVTDEGMRCLTSARRAAVAIQHDVSRMLGEPAEQDLARLLTKLINAAPPA
jgi:DNA-binding MarR family transcriptional regulator